MENTFAVKIGEFEGPLDLLLDLIEKRKLHISQVTLAQVADDYVNYLNAHPELPMGEMANFILVASTLMLIKSAALLPTLELTVEEKQSAEDLEKRLCEYQKIRELSVLVKKNYGRKMIFFREQSREMKVVFSPTPEITKDNLLITIKNLLNNLPVKKIIPQAIIKKVISLEEMIERLAGRVQSAIKMRFSEFAGKHIDKAEKVNVIVAFLGMLELVKRGIIEVEQQAHFSDINMETKEIGLPRYD